GLPSQQSTTGTLQKDGAGIKLITGSPSWLTTFIIVTNTINFVSFNVKFTSASEAQGLLSAYWDTNFIGSVDERVVQSGLQHYTFGLPKGDANSSHALGFR